MKALKLFFLNEVLLKAVYITLVIVMCLPISRIWAMGSEKTNKSSKPVKIKLDFRKQKKDNVSHSELNQSLAEAEREMDQVRGKGKDKSKGKASDPILGTSSMKIEESEQKPAFGATLIIEKTREINRPINGRFSTNETTFVFLPTYQISETYKAKLKLAGVNDSTDSAKSELKTGSMSLTNTQSDLSENFILSPEAVYVFPVNSTQRNTESFLGAAEGSLKFSNKKDLPGGVGLSATFGGTKSFYEYKTKLNETSDADDVYNSDYSFFEIFKFKLPIVGEVLNFEVAFTNRQKWDFLGLRNNSFEVSETLNWQITKILGFSFGISNFQEVKAAEKQLQYQFYNAKSSQYVVSISLGI